MGKGIHRPSYRSCGSSTDQMLPLLPNPAIASILVSGNYAQKGISLVSPGLREGKIGGPIPEQL